jgi:CTP:molybdopterin cytidylyltransferase MocA
MTRVAAAILAAGTSRRLGRPKQLLPFRGTTLLRAVAAEVCAAACDHVFVVVGAHATAVAQTVADLPVTIVLNAKWSEGIAASIRLATQRARDTRSDALALIACDQPQLSRMHVDRLIAMHRQTGQPAASGYAGLAGIPAVFGAREFAALASLIGDTGARHLLARSNAIAVEWPEGACDVDTTVQARRTLSD